MWDAPFMKYEKWINRLCRFGEDWTFCYDLRVSIKNWKHAGWAVGLLGDPQEKLVTSFMDSPLLVSQQ